MNPHRVIPNAVMFFALLFGWSLVPVISHAAPWSPIAQPGVDRYQGGFPDLQLTLEQEYANGCRSYLEKGQYHVVVDTVDAGCRSLFEGNFTEFVLEFDLGRLSGDGWAGGFGIVKFGYRGFENTYALHFSRVGSWWRMQKSVNSRIISLIPWNQGSSLHAQTLDQAPWDHIRLVVKYVAGGARIQVFSNDVLLGEFVDSEYAGGAVGVGARTFGTSAHVVFDNVQLDSAAP